MNQQLGKWTRVFSRAAEGSLRNKKNISSISVVLLFRTTGFTLPVFGLGRGGPGQNVSLGLVRAGRAPLLSTASFGRGPGAATLKVGGHVSGGDHGKDQTSTGIVSG